MQTEISAAILAGGQASRLGGIAKGLIPVDGKPIIARIAEIIAPFVGEIIIISNDTMSYEFLGLPVFPDDAAGGGPLQGILTALRNISCNRLLVVPCDMPFITEEAIRILIAYAPQADAVIPSSVKGLEPLFAIYSKACLDPAHRSLHSGNHRVVSFLHEVKTVYIPAEKFNDSIWFNINNPSDLRRIQAASAP
jgi:molybdenum cofactor guanylyltransferase